jgi:Uma2 family endonuclease
VDNSYVERLYKLLTEPLYLSWHPPGGQDRPYLALANVGWFHTSGEPPVVPDVMLSLDVVPRDPRTREGRSYFQWLLGKPPDLAIEVVSDLRADEDGEKMRLYARLGLGYYVIHDPDDRLGGGMLRVFELRGKRFARIEPDWIEDLGLGLTLWSGRYLDIDATWLRWCDRDGVVLTTGAEQAERERKRAADAEERIRRLEARLRGLGAEPEA